MISVVGMLITRSICPGEGRVINHFNNIFHSSFSIVVCDFFHRHSHSFKWRSKYFLTPLNLLRRRLVKLQNDSMPLIWAPFRLENDLDLSMRICLSYPTSTNPVYPDQPSVSKVLSMEIFPKIIFLKVALLQSGMIWVNTRPSRSYTPKTGCRHVPRPLLPGPCRPRILDGPKYDSSTSTTPKNFLKS